MAKASHQITFRRGMAASISNFRLCREYRCNPRLACRQAVAEYQAVVTTNSRAVKEG